GDPNFRKLVLNAIVWGAHVDVPANGVESPVVTMKLLEQNMDPKPKPANFDREKIREKLKIPADDKVGSGRRTEPGPASTASIAVQGSAGLAGPTIQVPPGRRDLLPS